MILQSDINLINDYNYNRIIGYLQAMDQNTKKKVIFIRDLIKGQKYQQALDQAQILIYKGTKVHQIYLMAGLCYDKLGKIKQAQQAYKQVLSKKPDEVNAIKALCDMYSKIGNNQKSAHYMQQMLAILKKTDPVKYRQNLVKLVQMHQKSEDMQKIDKIFKQLLQTQSQLSEQFVAIAESYFKTAITNKCFFLQQFLPLGVKGESFRVLLPNAKQKLNYIIIEIVRYLYSVRLQYKMDNKDISASIYQLKQYFPYASCFLMLYLLDDYCVSQTTYNATILQEIYLFLTAFYDKTENCYLNVQTLQPQIFIVSAILSYQYLSFMKQFFILDECFNPYFERLGSQIGQLQSRKIREQYSQKISKFILKQCRTVSKISETKNIQDRLQSLKHRITKLDKSYLQQVIAKMAMNCFVNYQKLSDMKNLLKTRINNIDVKQGEIQPHLYKYYYDYLLKIAKLYKSLDEQINIYDVIQYIKVNDGKDLKYLIEYYWIDVSRNSKETQQTFKLKAAQNLKQIQQLLPRIHGGLQSQAVRKQTVLKIILGRYGEVLDGLKIALGTDRSFENLQSIGFYYFIEGDFERALRFLKQAFIIKQDEYHLNRAIYIAMIKTNEYKEAYSFLQRIYEGFPNVYWVNYALAINSVNNRKFQLAYKYLSAAFQAFNSGVSKNFKFSYEKTIQGDKYSLIYMIDQNKIHLLFDEFVIPQKKIYELFPMASSIFFSEGKQLKQIKIETQLGQILKILGRNKSSYNHLVSAYRILQLLPQQTKKQNMLQVIVTKKEYATMLFYVRAYKEAQQIFKQTLRICQKVESGKISKDLLVVYQSQIHSLLFEVSVMRLDDLMKFQSYESVEQYICKFDQDLKELQGLVKKPSLNYYKAKYQFNILCYLHNKNIGVQKSIQTIRQFLSFFGLNYKQVSTDKFYNRLVELKNEQRIIVKECLQDYYVLLYMRQSSLLTNQTEKLTVDSLLPLIQLFPTSNVFYIVYGMAVQQTKLKIASFLKCIQLDRQSPISVDLLATLFLKQKDYLTACKLFLKSLQIDLFNPKSYIGLCTCLYVLIGSSIKRGQPEDKLIIRKALNKINSYMQFLRIVDPSQNYHMLKFLKTLLSDQPIFLFQLKAGLEQSRKLTCHKYSQKLLYRLLQQSTQYLKNFNIWKKQGQQQIFKKYLQNNNITFETQSDLQQIGTQLLARLQKQIESYKFESIESGQVRIKIKCKIINKLCICADIFVKARNLSHTNLNKFIEVLKNLEQKDEVKDQQLRKLQKTAKDVLLQALIKSHGQQSQDGAKLLQVIKSINLFKVFRDVPTFSHIQVYLKHFKKQSQLRPLKKYVFYNLHCYPCNEILRKSLISWLLVIEKQNNKVIKKIKANIEYKLQNLVQMNADEHESRMERFHKKHAIMYNVQQPNAWVGYIAELWKTKKQTFWMEHLKKILRSNQGKQNRLSLDSRKKAQWLLIQMSCQAIKNNQAIKIDDLSQSIKQSVESLSKLQIKNNSFPNGSLFNKQQSNLLKVIISYIVNKYKYSERLQTIIQECINQSKEPQTKGYFNLLKFISICSKRSKDQDEMISQLKKLLEIISICQPTQQNKMVRVHPNSISIMKCFVAYLSLNYQQLQIQLNSAYGNRFTTYSDQVLINYFEIIRVYRQVEVNHQGQNVFENFTEFINAMIQIVKEPVLKGLFYGLKAMAGAIIAEQNSQKLSRELKYSLILSPQSCKSLLKK